MKKVAIIQVRGVLKSSQKVRKTLRHLGLLRKHSCVLVDPTPSLKGMLLIVKDYVTWGEVDQDTIELLVTKRGKLAGNKPLTEDYLKTEMKCSLKDLAKNLNDGKNRLKDVPGMKPYFRLNPPAGGLGISIKKQYSLGGALGYRKDKINDLIKRMI